MKAYQSLQKEQDSLRLSAAGTEKKLQRKLSELEEVRALDLQAKTHMEESFRLMSEEKDEKINVMQTQVSGEEGKGRGEEGRRGEKRVGDRRRGIIVTDVVQVVLFVLGE